MIWVQTNYCFGRCQCNIQNKNFRGNNGGIFKKYLTTEIPSIAKIAVPKNKGRRSAGANHGKVSDDFNPFANMQQNIIPRPIDWIIFATIENGDKYLQWNNKNKPNL